MSEESHHPNTPVKNAYDRTSYVLVVDDDNTLLKFFKIHLNKFFSKVLVVKNAKEAVQALNDKEIDLVISDFRMPRTDGIQLMRKVRRHDPSIPFLLISGALLTEEQLKQSDHADGYLRKPFSVDELHSFIEHGMYLREKYKRLAEMLTDKSMIRKVILGRVKIEKAVLDNADVSLAGDILAELRKVG